LVNDPAKKSARGMNDERTASPVPPPWISLHTLAGALLFGATIAALLWANSPFAQSYFALWHIEIGVHVGEMRISDSLVHWINDLLMAIFFLQVGLEIKHELTVGQLNSLRKAATPAISAVGGMLIPIAIFLAVASSPPASRGWGIAMATDIAFALGTLRALGNRISDSSIAFLTALAIIDDLGAILVISVFYSGELSTPALMATAVLILALIVLNRADVQLLIPYLVVGALLWGAMVKSGIHATLAGVVVGLCVPGKGNAAAPSESELFLVTERFTKPLIAEESPLEHLEHRLNPWVNFVIVPLFALANAGVSFGNFGLGDLTKPITMAIFLGLFVGKQVGVFGATALAVKTGVGSLPSGMNWRTLYGLSLMAGVGFTMSLFVAGLAFGEGGAMLEQSKLAILCASAVSAVAGVLVLIARPPRSNS
jgi:Na+:H+ antiporter, NhaA family